MSRRIFTLTNVLSVALVGAVALLVFQIDRMLGGRTDVKVVVVETSNREGKRPHTRRPSASQPAEPKAGSTSSEPAVPTRPVVAQQSSSVPRLANAPEPSHALSLRRDSPVWKEENEKQATIRSVVGAPFIGIEAGEEIALALWQLAQVSHWSADALPPGRSFTIGILREAVLRSAAARLLAGTMANGRPIVVVGGDQAVTLADYPIVFVATVPEVDLFAGRPIMSVTATRDNFSDTWCLVELAWIDQQVSYVVDRAALGRLGIAIDDSFFKMENVYVRDAQGNAVVPPERSPGAQTSVAGGVLQ